MPIGFAKSNLTGSGFTPQETIITIEGSSGSNISGSGIGHTGYTVNKDELDIADNVVGSVNGKAIEIADGTYNVQITAISSTNATHGASASASYTGQIGAGHTGSTGSLPSGFTFSDSNTFTGSRSGTSGNIPITANLPVDLGNITFSSSKRYLFLKSTLSPSGGHTFNVPGYTITLFEIET